MIVKQEAVDAGDSPDEPQNQEEQPHSENKYNDDIQAKYQYNQLMIEDLLIQQLMISDRVKSEEQSEDAITKIQKQQHVKKVLNNILTTRDAKILCKLPDNLTMDSILTFQCYFNHIWDTNISIAQKFWCPKCQQSQKQLQKYANYFSGKLASAFYLKFNQFECHDQHLFTLSIHQIAKKQWCKKCQSGDASPKIEEEPNQQQIDSDALKKSFIRQFTVMLNKIKQQATEKANQYIAQHQEEEEKLYAKYDNLVQTFLILDLPSDTYIKYLKLLSKQELAYETQKQSILLQIPIPDFPLQAEAIKKFNYIISVI